jgi:hypothetical protein
MPILIGMEQFHHHDSILVSVTTLNGRKTTKQTKLHQVLTTGRVGLNETFHFQPFQQLVDGSHLLLSSRLRFRVYGRVSNTLVICIGELVVDLSEENLVCGEVQLDTFIGKVTNKKLKYYRE